MSVGRLITYGLTQELQAGDRVGPQSYNASNTVVMRPYQIKAGNSVGSGGYNVSLISGKPTVYDPFAGDVEDPIVVLLQKILGMNVVQPKPADAGYKSNVYVNPQNVDDDTTDFGSLNEFKSEIGRLSAPSATSSYETADSSSIDVNTAITYGLLPKEETADFKFSKWVDDLQNALDGSDYEGLEKDATSSGLNQQELDIIQSLDDILMDTRVLNLDTESGMARRFKSANVYYAGLAALTGEYTFGQAYDMLVRSDNLRLDRQRIIEEIKARGIEVSDALAENATSSGSSIGGEIDRASIASSHNGMSIDSAPGSSGGMSIDRVSAKPGIWSGHQINTNPGLWERRSVGGMSIGSSSRSSSKSGSKSGSLYSPTASNDGRREQGGRTTPVNLRPRRSK